MKQFINTFISAILAGFAIGIGGTVFLKVGGIVGAVLFSFGLLTVIHYGLALFTGRAGYFEAWNGLAMLFTAILVGNVLGCAMIASVVQFNVMEAARKVVESRLSVDYMRNFLLAVPCGFIMTTAVEFGRREKFLPLLFGVPAFILCGFRHSIADAFYYVASGTLSTPLLITWLAIVGGNFVGCNMYRLLLGKFESKYGN